MILLAPFDVAKAAGVDKNFPPDVLSLASAGTVYLALYALFNRYGWKVGPIGRWLKLPHLSGKWAVEGLTLQKQPNVVWSGTVTIVQEWDKLRVHLETPGSVSDSIAAALQPDEAAGYHLMYHYRNQPRLGTGDMAAHHGFAELIFAPGEQKRRANTSTVMPKYLGQNDTDTGGALMARDINDRLAKLKERRSGTDRLTSLNSSFAADVLNKSLLQESYQKRGTPAQPYTRYALGTMQEVDADYTQKGIDTATRVGKHLIALSIAVEFRLQGSVPLNVHIRGVSDVDLLTLDTGFLTYDRTGPRA